MTGTSAGRNLDHPMCLPPSKRIDNLCDNRIGRPWHSWNQLYCYRGSDQHPDRRRHSQPRRQPVDQDGAQGDSASPGQDQGVLGRVGQLLLLGGIDEWMRLPTSLPGTHYAGAHSEIRLVSVPAG